MLEAEGPNGLFAIFQEDEGSGYFVVYDPRKQEVLAQIRIYEANSNDPARASEIEIIWSTDQTKCGVAVRGRMRGIINIKTGQETCIPLESDTAGITAPELLEGFRTYMDENQFIRARQRYWKEMAKADRSDAGTPSPATASFDTNFIVHTSSTELIGVFEDDGDTGYLYLYSAQEQAVVRYLHVYDRSKTLLVSAKDVEVVWSQDGQKCGVSIWEKMRGIIDLTLDREGRVWLDNRNTPGIDDAEWLKGFPT